MTIPVPNEFSVGGRVLVGSTLGVGCGVSGLLMYTNGLFVADLEREIGLTRTQFGLAVLIVTLALAAANPVVGWCIDRYGVRRPLVFGLLGLAAGFTALGLFTDDVATYLALQGTAALLAAASGPAAYTKTISAWFSRNRGLALGITMMGIGLAGTLLPRFIAGVIASDGWRVGYFALAGIAVAGLLPVLLLVRLPPAASGNAAASSSGMSVAHAVRTPIFWILIGGFGVMGLAFAGLIPHFVPMLTGLGVDPLEAGALAGLIGVAVIISRVLVGWLVDRVSVSLVAIGVCCLCASGCVVLLLMGKGGAAVGALAIGAAMGGELDLVGFLVARHFGMAAFGRIYGMFYAAFIVATGMSPLWMGIVYDRTGSYRQALYITIALLVVASLLFLRIPRSPGSRRIRAQSGIAAN